MSIKINKLEIENVKRVKAVKMEPSDRGLTIIGGDSARGKSSVLDSIAWALGGKSFQPSMPGRSGAAASPYLRVVLSNGIVVERKGKNSDLKVTDPSGKKAGQALLDSFIEKLALDLPKFMAADDKEKAKILLNVIGVGEELQELEKQEKELYQERTIVGREADRKRKFAEEQAYYPDVPEDIISPSELIKQQQEILARNGENQRKRDRLKEISIEKHRIFDEIERLKEQVKELTQRITERSAAYKKVSDDEDIAMKDAAKLHDESTAELEKSIADIDEINRKVRANLDREKAVEDARASEREYSELTKKIEAARSKKQDLAIAFPAAVNSEATDKQTYSKPDPGAKQMDFIDMAHENKTSPVSALHSPHTPKDTLMAVPGTYMSVEDENELPFQAEEPEEKAQEGEAVSKYLSDPDRVPQKLKDLMEESGVCEWNIQDAVFFKGYYPENTLIQDMDPAFVEGWIIAFWPKVCELIETIKQNQEVPFNKIIKKEKAMNDNYGEALDWNSEISAESQFELLPEGVYDFTIESMERGYFNGSEKMSACPSANLKIIVRDPATREDKGFIFDTLYLNSKAEWRISQLLIAIGQKKKGEPTRPNWNQIPGSSGKLELSINHYTDKNGNKNENNRVKRYIPKEVKTFVPGKF